MCATHTSDMRYTAATHASGEGSFPATARCFPGSLAHPILLEVLPRHTTQTHPIHMKQYTAALYGPWQWNATLPITQRTGRRFILLLVSEGGRDA